MQVRARAKAIYLECLKQSGQKPLDRVVIECLQAEGFKEYTPASIAQWRKADQWDEEGDKHVTEGGKSLSPDDPLVCNARRRWHIARKA